MAQVYHCIDQDTKMKNQKVKSIGLTLAALTFSVVFSVAPMASQAQAHPHRNGMGRLNVMDSVLNLSDAQQKQIAAIFKDSRPKIKEARQMKDSAQIKAKRAEIRAQIDAVLSNEQRQKWAQFRQSSAPAGKHNLQGKIENLKAELNLTEIQAQQLQDAMKNHALNIKLIKEKLADDTQAAHLRMKQEHERFNDQLKGFLSAQQLEKWRQIRQAEK